MTKEQFTNLLFRNVSSYTTREFHVKCLVHSIGIVVYMYIPTDEYLDNNPDSKTIYKCYYNDNEFDDIESLFDAVKDVEYREYDVKAIIESSEFIHIINRMRRIYNTLK